MTQRRALDEIGLAAAIGADDARQPALDDEIAGLDEGLEAEEAKPREFHGRPGATGRPHPASLGDGPRAAAGR